MKFSLAIAAVVSSGLAGLVSGGPIKESRGAAPLMKLRKQFPASQADCLYYMYCGRCDADGAICDGNGNIQLTDPTCEGDCYCKLVCPSP